MKSKINERFKTIKMKVNKNLILLLAFSLFLAGCRKEDGETDDTAGKYNITMKVNGNDWKGYGQSGINDVSSPATAYMLMTAYSDEDSSSEPEFSSMLKGASLTNGNTIVMKGGFNNGEYFGLKINGTDYVTNKAPSGQETGSIKITSYGSRITGELSATLYAENGSTVQITNGAFSFEVMHF